VECCCTGQVRTFYIEALKPLSWRAFGNYDAGSGPETEPDLYRLGDDVYVTRTGVGSSPWLRQRKPGETGLYLGIVCDTIQAVDAAYAAAIGAGGIDEGSRRPTGPISPRAIARPTSPTSTAAVSSASTKAGTSTSATRVPLALCPMPVWTRSSGSLFGRGPLARGWSEKPGRARGGKP
jgi:hypothetical protein